MSTHRWVGLIAGLLLIVQATSGAVLVFHPELFRLANPGLYSPRAAPPGAPRISLDAAAEAASRGAPGFVPTDIAPRDGVDQVSDANGRVVTVDPTTGRVLGRGDLQGGVLGFLDNLHECAFSCSGYPAYIATLNRATPWFPSVTYGDLLLGVLGLVLAFLVAGGVVVWWPGLRKLRRTWRIRVRGPSYRRNLDLHRVVGAATVPFVAMWAVTGAAFELPFVGAAWYAATGSHQIDYTPPKSATASGHDIGAARAAAVAVAAVGGGHVGTLTLPATPDGSYLARVAHGFDQYHADLYGSGDWFIAIDRHTGAARYFYEDRDHEDLSQLVWSQSEGIHEGTFGPWYVRALWAFVGLTPLLLAVSGTATWWHRRRVAGRHRPAPAPA